MRVPSAQEKFNIKTSLLTKEQVMIMKSYKKMGEQHLKYYNSTMSAFKNPEARMKCYDTLEFEELIPQVTKILNTHEMLKALPND